MLDAGALIQKHQSKGVLVDSNLLVLLLIGRVNRRRIPDSKRTQNFTMEDFDTLLRLIGWFGKLFTTPHVLSQISDLAELSGKEQDSVRRLLRSTVEEMEESYDPSKDLVTHPLFSRLGLADAAIAMVCARGPLVLTADLSLQLALEHAGADALNFNHVRPSGWR